MRRLFADYNGLANGVLRSLSLAMPEIDYTGLKEMPLAPRRVVKADVQASPRPNASS
jgi:hypothetical protein